MRSGVNDTSATTTTTGTPRHAVPVQTGPSAVGDAYPLLPADARITVGKVMLDGTELDLCPGDTDRLRRIAPSLTGRVLLCALPAADAALVRRLLGQGIAYDLRVSRGCVPTAGFCDYLYTRIGRWRTGKAPDKWPWRQVTAAGSASVRYLQGILIENYHYVRAASVRQSPLLSRAATVAQFDMVRDFVTGEASHEAYFAKSLTRWAVPRSAFENGVPLASTAAFIGLQYRLAHKSLLDYFAGSAVLEVNPEVYARVGDPYQQWESVYGIDPYVLAPVRRHIADDVACGHASLFRQIAADACPELMPVDIALSALASARTVFNATRLWQRDTYEHYQLGDGHPVAASL